MTIWQSPPSPRAAALADWAFRSFMAVWQGGLRGQDVDSACRILGVILAGGASRRFGTDKALVPLAGVPLIEHVAHRARPQVDALAISRGPDVPVPLDLPVIRDQEAAQGPLSGIGSSLAWAEANGFDLIATFPCDGPLFPSDLVARLSTALAGCDCTMARSGDDRHHTYGLWRTDSRPRVAQAFRRGLRSLRGIADVLSVSYLDFGPAVFLNINSPENLGRAEELLAQHEAGN